MGLYGLMIWSLIVWDVQESVLVARFHVLPWVPRQFPVDHYRASSLRRALCLYRVLLAHAACVAPGKPSESRPELL